MSDLFCGAPDRLPPSRREFLKILGAGLASLSALNFLGGGCAPSAPGRPNFVFILTDDHAYDAMGCAGHAWIRTPALDRLAGDGVRFSNAFVTSSLCSPSRASFLTGLYPHEHGVVSNEVQDIPAGMPTFPQLLRQAGYRTAFVGKWHMGRFARPRPGFDHWISFNSQGDYLKNTLNVDGTWELCENYITDEITARGVSFLEQADDRPFMLMLSHKAIHQPFLPAARHATLYDDAVVTNDLPTGDRLDLKPDWGGRRQEPDLRGFLLANARTLAAVDEGVASILDVLARSGRLDDTVIVYASDNGFLKGEHGGLWDKRVAYEPSIRIPLLVRYPRVFAPGTVCEELALNIDLMPTLLKLAGVPTPARLSGLSLAELTTGTASRESFLYEYFQELGSAPTTVALRSRRYKYITYPQNPEYTRELYDLHYDPHELINRVDEAAYGAEVARLDAELESLKSRTGFRMMKAEVG